MAYLRLSILIHEDHPIEFGGRDTIGAIVDQHISDAISHGQEIMELKLNFDDDQEQANLRAAYIPKLSKKAG